MATHARAQPAALHPPAHTPLRFTLPFAAPFQDMIAKDPFVRDFDVRTSSIETLLASVDQNFSKPEASKHESLAFELQRVAMVVAAHARYSTVPAYLLC